jgi:hypothetical protein
MGFGAGYYGQRDNAVAIGTLAGAGTVYAIATYVAAGSSGTTLMISRAVYSTGTIVPGMRIQATGFSNQTVVAVVSATQLTISAAPDTALENGLGLQFFKGQGANSIAIGNQAGSPYGDVTVDFQESNTIILNATGTALIGVDGQENSFYVAPIRNASGADGLLQYNLSSKEVTYGKLSYNDLLNKPDLAATYTWSIAADDSTQLEISAGNLVKIVGTRGVTTTSNADGQITITGPDLSTYATQSYVNAALSSAGITISATVPVGLSDGALWYNSSNLELYVRYDNAWVAASSSSSADTDYNDLINKPTNVSQFTNDANYVSRDEVYAMILELGSTNF